MTSPAEKMRVRCPRCQTVFVDWYRASINRQVDPWAHDDYVRQCGEAQCPDCATTVELGTLVVERDEYGDELWTLS